MDVSLLDLVLATVGVLLVMALVCCLFCLWMKISDLRLKCYVIEMANRKGIPVDVYELDPKHPSNQPKINDTCTIMVPEVGIIL